MKALITKFVKDESGATAIEYAMIAGLISIVALVAIQASSGSLLAIWANIQAALAAAAG